MFFCFEVKAENDMYASCGTEYIASYSYEQAVNHIKTRLERAGWKAVEIEGYRIDIVDIRDKCDHITD